MTIITYIFSKEFNYKIKVDQLHPHRSVHKHQSPVQINLLQLNVIDQYDDLLHTDN